MKLYTKNNCLPCKKVKEYLESRDLRVDTVVDEYQSFSPTYPVLVGDTWFARDSEYIIEYLTTHY
jgi:glutaredoxin